MLRSRSLLTAGSLLLSGALAENWAVIIASSCGYDNYRHQADAHHAYALLVEQGIPLDNIIFFACDDIAYHEDNPFQGEIFNEPNGDNVYDPDSIDYTGDDVNAEKFMAVMMGDAKGANGKVLRSTIEDNVFLFFVDHGAPGILAFPGPDDKHPFSFFYADQLMDTFEYMYTHRMFKEMVVYVEACEAGSMFVDMPEDMNIYVMTASDEEVSSWAIYCDEEAIIDGKDLGTCLGDLFSINWMNDTVNHIGDKRTLLAQYHHVKEETRENEELDRKGSPVCTYGDLGIQSRSSLEDFQAGQFFEKQTPAVSYSNNILGYLLGFTPKLDVSEQEESTWDTYTKPNANKPKVNSRDAKLHFLMGRYNSSQGMFAHDDLANEIRHRMALDTAFFSLFPDIYEQDGHTFTLNIPSRKVTDFDCLRFLMESFENKCMPFSEYGLGHVKYIVEFCETKTTSEIVDKAMDMQHICNDIVV